MEYAVADMRRRLSDTAGLPLTAHHSLAVRALVTELAPADANGELP